MRPNAETYPYGIVREWLDDRRIVAISSEGDMQRPAIDTWAQVCIATQREWPSGVTVLCLCDLCRSVQSFTPYALRRTEDILRARPDSQVSVIAITIADALVRWQVQVVLRLSLPSLPDFSWSCFGSRGEGLSWLRAYLRQQPEALGFGG